VHWPVVSGTRRMGGGSFTNAAGRDAQRRAKMAVAVPPHGKAANLIAPELQRELLNHAGEWVAITKTELLGTGATPVEALAAARAKGAQRPMLYRVPRDGDTDYFF
jgi:hypothetical protein